MQDRFADLKRLGGGINRDIEIGQDTIDISDNYEKVIQLLRTVNVNIKVIDQKYAANFEIFSTEDSSNIKNEIHELCKITNKNCTEINTILKEMKREIDSLQQNDAEKRIKENRYNVLSKRFYDFMSNYQELKNRNNIKIHERAKYFISTAIGESPTDEQVDQIIESGNISSVFKNRILLDKRHNNAENTLVYMKDKHNDILELEKGINELHVMFLDMITIIETQGEMIDCIEFNVVKSLEYNGDTLDKFQHEITPRIIQQRKKLCIIFSLVFCILCVIVSVMILVIILTVCLGSTICKFNINNGSSGSTKSSSIPPHTH